MNRGLKEGRWEWRREEEDERGGCQGNSPLLIVYFLSYSSPLSIPYVFISSTSTGSLSSDCDCYGHSHVM
jgi:hypothetical protein